MKNQLIPIVALILLSLSTYAQEQTVGLFGYEAESFEGYTLFHPMHSTDTYLIDNCGRQIHKWESSYFPGNSTYLLENGNLLRTAKTTLISNPVFPIGGAGEKIQLVDWDGTTLWEFSYSDSLHRMHHDVQPLPNGNVLILAWELKSKEEAIAAGRDPDLLWDDVLWSEQIVEVQPFTDSIVWQWNLWDHIIQDFDETKANYGVVGDHPEKLNINYVGENPIGTRDWLHTNSIDYNPKLDQIVINCSVINEFLVIDHSTNREQAAGSMGGNSGNGGDLLYRWGNPEAYDHGSEEDRQLFGAHDVRWIPEGYPDEGKIMLFNNGFGRPEGDFSSVDVLEPPVADTTTGQYLYTAGNAFGPVAPFWSYTADPAEDFYAVFLSGAQRLPNGNTLICNGAEGRFFEVNQEKETIWDYVSPVINGSILAQGDEIPLFGIRNANIVFRCTRYGKSYQGFEGKDLTPGDPLELNFPEPYDCSIISSSKEMIDPVARFFPNPATTSIRVEFGNFIEAEVRILDRTGKVVSTASARGNTLDIDLRHLTNGLYFLAVDGFRGRKFIIDRQ